MMPRLLSKAWFASIVAAGFGFLYLAFAPIPMSHAADMTLAIAAACVGAAIGTMLESAIATRVASRRSRAEVIHLDARTPSYDHMSARGA